MFVIVKYVGVVYLLYLVYKMFIVKDFVFVVDNKEVVEYKVLYKKGVIMNLLNLKVLFFFFVFLF